MAETEDNATAVAGTIMHDTAAAKSTKDTEEKSVDSNTAGQQFGRALIVPKALPYCYTPCAAARMNTTWNRFDRLALTTQLWF